eukprot:TRINITY_DN27286_c0_g1_i1.p1 TRINITY_DN27286_c0_g1~~TRINITY_DN27286_c0_g1_i1.p1  ORF type:complete len:453 (+),score=192.50 TRINITY_DN27286_c0_g1_i1:185-1360(+)
MVPGKGKGVFALSEFKCDDTVITENALACAQNMDDMRDGIKCCAMTLKSLETPKDNLLRASGAFAETDLPMIDDFCSAIPIVPCTNSEKGCKQFYGSEPMRVAAWHRFHNSLCTGAMNEAQRTAYDVYISESWIQGGIDYSDTFQLGMHMLAIMYSGMKLGETVEEVTAPFNMLISCPWQRFVFSYLLDEEDQVEEGKKTEEDTRTKEQTLEKAMGLLRIIFGVGADDALLTEARFTRLLGAILLNGQERRPTSPWVQYVTWLKLKGSRKDYKAMKALAKNNPKLQYSTRGQGVYRICSCFNHSCDPNIQVSYCDDNDESLVVHALRDIRKGEELCISYIDEDAEYSVRQEQLLDHYLFKCTCVKCTAYEAAQAQKGDAAPEAAGATSQEA